ncbi:4'-phosphopantetheinyl transferase family protein [Streptomyces pseudovenezuelae]|uniref:4'-phosphopantetheinyl transferase EntD n=1 Tax=Streptomyces pseudovenezuelae TaxID=67350 RepID=A0ABT6M303_9ACTN|nr:hypothetical protein [Streptomyces pseudovenezuelae]MDH6222924.1 4'-phosphopantetheinyl transferase EntD [Streptomyces pseudovenezuelae]
MSAGAGARVLVVDCDWAGRRAPEVLLGPCERAHAASLTGARRVEWVRTRLTAKAAVHWATGASATEILPDPDGAPQVQGGPHGIAVSLAHTGELTVCAVTEAGTASLIGVDVEPVDARNNILLPRLLGLAEPPRLGPEPSPGLLATVLVAAKEAALKAYHRPSSALRDYQLRQESDGTLRVGVTGQPHHELRVWWVCRAGSVTAVCATGDRPPEHRAVTTDEVLAALAAQ